MNVDVNLAERLADEGRWSDVAGLLEPVIEASRSAGLWAMLAMARLHIGRRSDAADAMLRAAQLDAEGGRAWLNAAVLLDQEGRVGETEIAVRESLGLGFEPPEAHYLLGRALRGAGQIEEAEMAFRKAVETRPTFADAHRELAQLRWMRTGDLTHALEALESAIARHPGHPRLRMERTWLLDAGGDSGEAEAEAARALVHMGPGTQRNLFEAHRANLRKNYQAGAEAALRAIQAGARDGSAFEALAAAQLGLGDSAALLATVDLWLGADPLNQLAIAYRATALRLSGDPHGAAYRDYDRLVRAFEIDVPEGWPDLDAYLTSLSAALAKMHPFQAHPLGQSARSGSQTMQSLVRSTDPAIVAFFNTIDGPIRRYLAGLGSGTDPLRSRNFNAYEIKGCWSVWLRPGGFHVDHVHPQGWISSACYVAVPQAAEDSERKEGWIRFGQPPIQPPGGLPAEHFVQPKPGRLVLFPAWMWHGTVPFTSDERRLTVAFDVLSGHPQSG